MRDDIEEEKNENEPSTSEEGLQQESGSCGITELQALADSLREYKEKYVRLLAESENARKRMQKEKQDLTRYAVENVISDILTPLDHFEKALGIAEKATPEVKNWAIGFEMILGQFKDAISNQGVKEYKSLGSQFDPHLHEAVEMIETNEYPPGTVIEECVRGYKMGEKAIRVARVKVAKSPRSSLQEEDNKQTNEGGSND